MTIARSVRVRDLPSHHRDPFDRLLVARDLAIRSYPIQTFWE